MCIVTESWRGSLKQFRRNDAGGPTVVRREAKAMSMGRRRSTSVRKGRIDEGSGRRWEGEGMEKGHRKDGWD